MIHLDGKIFIILAVLVITCSVVFFACNTQNNTTTFSGKLIDVEGRPISGHNITLYPVVMSENGSVFYEPIATIVNLPHFLTTRTDRNGYFTIKGDINPGMIRLGLISPKVLDKIHKQDFNAYNIKSQYDLISVKIGEMTFYGDEHGDDSTTFSLQTEHKVKDAVITARPEMWISGKIVFADGKPLISAPITFKVQYRQIDMSPGGSYGDRIQETDEKGNFSYSLFYHSEPILYMVSVEYQELSATSKEIRINGGERYEGLMLKLNGDSKDIPEEPKPPEPVHFPGRVQLPTKLTPGEWIVNPANGHAYAKILCESFEAAMVRATNESAHLVAINDEAEQKWLSGVFGYRLYWIGLHKVENGVEWKWDNDDPLTYTNWGPKGRFPPDILSEGEKEAGVMSFVDGEWHAVGPGDLFWDVTKMAILEKDDVSIGTPSEDR